MGRFRLDGAASGPPRSVLKKGHPLPLPLDRDSQINPERLGAPAWLTEGYPGLGSLASHFETGDRVGECLGTPESIGRPDSGAPSPKRGRGGWRRPPAP